MNQLRAEGNESETRLFLSEQIRNYRQFTFKPIYPLCYAGYNCTTSQTEYLNDEGSMLWAKVFVNPE